MERPCGIPKLTYDVTGERNLQRECAVVFDCFQGYMTCFVVLHPM
jgi:hypothetical protein